MDYNKVFEDKYHDTYNKLDEYIVRQFKEGYYEGQNFSDLYNYVGKALQIKVADLSQEPLIENNQALIDRFRKFNLVKKGDLVDPKVLEIRLKPNFQKTNDDDNFLSFVTKFAELKASEILLNNFYDYNDFLFRLYGGKIWKDFTLVDYDDNYRNSKKYEDLKKNLETVKSGSGSIDNVSVSSPKENKDSRKNFSKERAIIKSQLQKFSEQEKIFLLKVFYEEILGKRKGMDRTEFIKFSHIISEIEDLSIFYKKAYNAGTYNLTQKKYEFFSKLEDGKFFEILLNQLEALDLKTIKSQIRIIQSKTK